MNFEKMLLDNIKAGMVYGTIEKHRLGGAYFHPVLYKTMQGNIGWTHYGSSANDCNLDGLKFILDVVFHMDALTFMDHYYTRDEYNRLDAIFNYEGECKAV